ncbi:MAG TPA: UvrD-helicase domain-containing protein [Tepidisphaeraceae bacterium]|nr:UvrD-helicase domain-containing protein [Tepidisphaeraceae bacterium]
MPRYPPAAPMQLNPQQELVANHVHGRILTLAGPGSGKTRTLTERTGRLIRRGFDPASILCLTFTNKARDEMRTRIAAIHGAGAEKVFISNFHGLCGTLLRRFGAALGYTQRMTICDADDQIDLILQLARKRGQQPTKPEARTLAWLGNAWRENFETDADLDAAAASRKIARNEINIVREYVKLLRSRNQCDFSGLLSETVRLLREQDDVRHLLRQRFRFVQVDEYQDTNRAQNEIVELLAGEEDNVLAVGDGDQSIYEWRGASPDAIPQFIRAGQRKTGKCAVVKLGLNYRSTPQIIKTADTLIRHCKDRIAVDFDTPNRPGEAVKCAKLDNPEAEGEALAVSIDNTIKSGVPPREVAVFFRTNDMSRLIEQSLAKRQIPYQVVGSGSYYDRMEVRDVLSMLRFVCNPRDGIAFHRIANKPARGMGDALIGRIESFAERHDLDLLTVLQERNLEFIGDEQDKPLSDAALRACRETRGVFDLDMRNMSVGPIAAALFERSRYNEWLKSRYDEKGEYEDRSRNVHELLNAIAEFDRRERGATIEDYLQSISLYTSGDDAKTENAVRLMSLHASKGLEFDVVYLIGLEHKILPHEKALQDRGERGLDEERRLCYVGFTRARRILRVTWCAKRQDTYARGKTARFKATIPSQFLVEAGLLTRDEYQKAMVDAEFVPRAAPKAKPRGRAKAKAR